MPINDISLTAGMRINLINLQSTTSLLNRTQNRLSTGKKVNTALDNPTNYFGAQNHMQRASDLSVRKDAMSEAIQGVQATDKGISAISSLIESAKGLAQVARSADAAGRASLAAQFNEVRSQVTKLAGDSGYKGRNFLSNDSLNVLFNETGGSYLTIQGFYGNAEGLKVGQAGLTVNTLTGGTTAQLTGATGTSTAITGTTGTIQVVGLTGFSLTDLASIKLTLTGAATTGFTGATITFSRSGDTFSGTLTKTATATQTGVTGTTGMSFSFTLADFSGASGAVTITYSGGSTGLSGTLQFSYSTINQATFASSTGSVTAVYLSGTELASTSYSIVTGTNSSGAVNEYIVLASSAYTTGSVLTFNQATGTAGWATDTQIDASMDGLDSALSTLRTQSASLASNLNIITIRNDFTQGMIDTLQKGADNLTLADMNEEGANMLMLQTRQSLGTTALSLSSQAAQAILKLF